MDTQRLILFVIFSMSALFLWEAWQKEQRPPVPPTVAASAQPGTAQRAAGDIPAAPAAKSPGDPGVAPAPAAGAAAPAGQLITVNTDLFRAEIDTRGGVIALIALDKHRDAQDPSKPYLAAATKRRAHVRRTGRPDRRGHAESPDAVHGAAGPARVGPRDRYARSQARGHGRERRQGRQGADVPPRQLRHRRRVPGDEHRRGADHARGVLPADARCQAGGRPELDGARGIRRPGRLQRGRQVQEGRVLGDRQDDRRPDAQVAVHQEC